MVRRGESGGRAGPRLRDDEEGGVCRRCGASLLFEALLCSQDLERGLIPAEEFVATAEETRQLIIIGRWALVEVCRQVAGWQEQFCPDPPLFVGLNLSRRRITHPDLVGRVKEARVDGRRLEAPLFERLLPRLDIAGSDLTGKLPAVREEIGGRLLLGA